MENSQLETETRMEATESNDVPGVLLKQEVEGLKECEEWRGEGAGSDSQEVYVPDRSLGIQGLEDQLARDQADAREFDSNRARTCNIQERESRAEGSPNIDQIIMQSFHKERKEQAPAKVWKTNNYNRVPNLNREQQNARLENNKHLNHFPSSLITAAAQSRAVTRAEAEKNPRSERATRLIRNNSQGQGFGLQNPQFVSKGSRNSKAAKLKTNDAHLMAERVIKRGSDLRVDNNQDPGGVWNSSSSQGRLSTLKRARSRHEGP